MTMMIEFTKAGQRHIHLRIKIDMSCDRLGSS